MVYTFELIKHSNVRYREAVIALSRCELIAMLRALNLDCPVEPVKIGGADFLQFECRELSERELSRLSGHSSVSFMAELSPVSSLLRPLDVVSSGFLPEDLPEILKYKGKTGVPFTRMMINTALALTPFANSRDPVTLFDPICGKGTSCFCALCAGMNAVGADQNSRDIKEATDYFLRYLKYHRLKHRAADHSETAGKISIPVTCFDFSDTKEHFQSGIRRQLRLACADTTLSPSLFRREKAHILVADLPYGIQHAPTADHRPESLIRFLTRVLPEWKKTLMPGGSLALSFNTLTLPTPDVEEAVERAGFVPVKNEWTGCLTHTVEQAVVRNVVFAVNH